MNLVSLIVVILVFGLVFALVVWLIDQIPTSAPFKVVARALLAIFAIIILLGMVFGAVTVPSVYVR